MNVALLNQLRAGGGLTRGNGGGETRPMRVVSPPRSLSEAPSYAPQPNASFERRLIAIENQLASLTKALSDAAKVVNTNDDEMGRQKKILKGIASFLKKTAAQVDNITSYLAGEGDGSGVVEAAVASEPVPATRPDGTRNPVVGLSDDDMAMFTQGDGDELGES